MTINEALAWAREEKTNIPFRDYQAIVTLVTTVQRLQEENAAMRKAVVSVEAARDYAEMLASNYPFDLTPEEEKFIKKCQSLDQMFDALDAGEEE